MCFAKYFEFKRAHTEHSELGRQNTEGELNRERAYRS